MGKSFEGQIGSQECLHGHGNREKVVQKPVEPVGSDEYLRGYGKKENVAEKSPEEFRDVREAIVNLKDENEMESFYREYAEYLKRGEQIGEKNPQEAAITNILWVAGHCGEEVSARWAKFLHKYR